MLVFSDPSDCDSACEAPSSEVRIDKWLAERGIFKGDPRANQEAFFSERRSKVSNRLSNLRDSGSKESITNFRNVTSTRSSEQLFGPSTLVSLGSLAARRNINSLEPIFCSPQHSPRKNLAASRQLGDILTLYHKLSADTQETLSPEIKSGIFLKDMPPPMSAPIPDSIGEFRIEDCCEEIPDSPGRRPKGKRRPKFCNDLELLIDTAQIVDAKDQL